MRSPVSTQPMALAINIVTMAARTWGGEEFAGKLDENLFEHGEY